MSNLNFWKSGEGEYSARVGEVIYKVQLDTEKDRYQVLVNGEIQAEAQDPSEEEEVGYFYYLKNAKKYLQGLAGVEEKVSDQVYLEWSKVDPIRDNKEEGGGYLMVGSEPEIRIRLNRKMDRYEILVGKKVKVTRIYNMVTAKELAGKIYLGQEVTDGTGLEFNTKVR